MLITRNSVNSTGGLVDVAEIGRKVEVFVRMSALLKEQPPGLASVEPAKGYGFTRTCRADQLVRVWRAGCLRVELRPVKRRESASSSCRPIVLVRVRYRSRAFR
jgi:hypothetical protein